jgi:hypothetical protein
VFCLFQDTYTIKDEDDKVEFLFCIVGSVFFTDVCLFLKVQRFIFVEKPSLHRGFVGNVVMIPLRQNKQFATQVANGSKYSCIKWFPLTSPFSHYPPKA